MKNAVYFSSARDHALIRESARPLVPGDVLRPGSLRVRRQRRLLLRDERRDIRPRPHVVVVIPAPAVQFRVSKKEPQGLLLDQ